VFDTSGILQHTSKMAAPHDVKVDMDKPPPYAPHYESAPQHQGYPPSSQGYNPGNPGGYPPPQQHGGYPPQHGGYASPPMTQHQPATSHSVIVVQSGHGATGNCPVCRTGNMIEEYSCCGICCAIFFFPIGLICCLLMKNRRCSHCNATQ
jgi:hypothetical protein